MASTWHPQAGRAAAGVGGGTWFVEPCLDVISRKVILASGKGLFLGWFSSFQEIFYSDSVFFSSQ